MTERPAQNPSPLLLPAWPAPSAGTALGDPIEVGAAAAVLVEGPSGRGASPLVLMASKSWIGHAEPAAGVVGLAHAHAAASRMLQLPLMHLGELNPYVTALMGQQQSRWAAPRQPAALAPAVAQAHSLCGVSAFAFQGTNAHVLLRSEGGVLGAEAPACAPLGASLHWQRQRHWVRPPAHR